MSFAPNTVWGFFFTIKMTILWFVKYDFLRQCVCIDQQEFCLGHCCHTFYYLFIWYVSKVGALLICRKQSKQQSVTCFWLWRQLWFMGVTRYLMCPLINEEVVYFFGCNWKIALFFLCHSTNIFKTGGLPQFFCPNCQQINAAQNFCNCHKKTTRNNKTTHKQFRMSIATKLSPNEKFSNKKVVKL